MTTALKQQYLTAGLIACITMFLGSGLPAAGQSQVDPRDIQNGSIIPDEDWGEQPLIVKLADGRWFCVLTTGRGKEGSSSQHIVYTISGDKGKTWTALRDIEPASEPEASSACPFIVPTGSAKERIYVFYVFNAHDVRKVKTAMDGRSR